jgi:hypothetical protein
LTHNHAMPAAQALDEMEESENEKEFVGSGT